MPTLRRDADLLMGVQLKQRGSEAASPRGLRVGVELVPRRRVQGVVSRRDAGLAVGSHPVDDASSSICDAEAVLPLLSAGG